MTDVHLKLGPGRYACDAQALWGSQSASSTIHKLAVTCEACIATPSWKALRQIIPLVQGGPYRG